MTPEQYQQNFSKALKLLEGDFSEVLEMLEAKMAKAVEELAFEEAASCRDVYKRQREWKGMRLNDGKF